MLTKQPLGFQIQLPLVKYELESETIHQRVRDGYVNATAMCKAANRPWARYWETTQAKEFARELSADIGIPISELIQSVKGGEPTLQGTWVHPQVAITVTIQITCRPILTDMKMGAPYSREHIQTKFFQASEGISLKFG